MSTILDALRKLQRERDAAGRQRQALPPMVSAARGRRSWAWIGAVVALVLGGAASGYWLMGIRDSPAPTQVARQESPQVAQLDPPAEERALAQVREAARQRAARTPPATRALPVEPQPVAPAEATADAPMPETPEPVAESAKALREPEPAKNPKASATAAPAIEKAPAPVAKVEVDEEPEVAMPAIAKPEVVPVPVVKAPPPPVVAKQEPPPPVARPVAPAAPPKPPAARRRAPAPPPEPEPEYEYEYEAEPEPEPAYEASPKVDVAQTGAAGSVAASFPHVVVESVRWHPDPVRRVARLHLPTIIVDEAHEGEEFGGILVHRIEPAAVEVGYRGARQLIRMGR